MNKETFSLPGYKLRTAWWLPLGIIPFVSLLLGVLVITARSSKVTPPVNRARLFMVIVLDGLRPDSINEKDTPNLYRLRAEGVDFPNAHSVFPTVTRVNAAALATGTYPTTNGLVSNSMYVPEVGTAPFTTAEYLPLLKLAEVSGGRLLFARSLGERLQEQQKKLAVVCSGSTGLSLVLNPKTPVGVGAIINGYFESGKVAAYPAEVSRTVMARFGPAPAQDPPHQNLNAAVDWAETVLREYVLPELKPDVLIDWMSEPDDTQHPKGAGSPEARTALRNCDRNIGLLLQQLAALGLADKTDLIVISDHGFAQHTKGVNVKEHLIAAGLKQSAGSSDVVVVPNAQSILLHVKNHSADRIRRIVEYLQRQDWTDVIFTHAQRPVNNNGITKRRKMAQSNLYGFVPGTFSLELIHEANSKRGPDIVFTLPWTTELNRFGVPGTSFANSTGSGAEITGDPNGHGGLNPAVVRSTMIAWGVDFKRGVKIEAPSSNVDVAPTILRLIGISGGAEMDGRVLTEALRAGGSNKEPSTRTRTFTVRAVNGYRASIQISQVGKYRYIDQGRKIPVGKPPAR